MADGLPWRERIARLLFGRRHTVGVRVDFPDGPLRFTMRLRARSRGRAAAEVLNAADVQDDLHDFQRIIIEVVTDVGS